ncbi:MAG: hypothetical protein ACLRWC_04570 [Acutalibacter sp.]
MHIIYTLTLRRYIDGCGTYLLQQGHQILDLIDGSKSFETVFESQDIQISVPNGASAIFTNRLPNQFAGRPISYTEVDEDEWISGLEKGVTTPRS